MLYNILKIALRNFSKNKWFTFLNVVGLALGLASSILILQYVKYEKSHDSFHTKSDRIYRVQYNMVQNGVRTVEAAVAVPRVGQVLKDNYSQVEEFTRLYKVDDVLLYNDVNGESLALRERKMAFADKHLFKLFDFTLIQGDAETALDGLNKLVLTQKTADRYFKGANPIGKILSWDSGYGMVDFEVTGVLSQWPSNSHINFDVFLSIDNLWSIYGDPALESWTWYDFYTYILLEEGSSPDTFKSSFEEYLSEVRADHWKQYNYYQEFNYQPLEKIHLTSSYLQEIAPEELGNEDSTYFLTIISFFILFIAYVNYINLSTAKAIERSNEVGVRKVLGASRKQLVRQFLAESLIINLLSLLLALLTVAVGWEQFSLISGRPIPFTYLFQTDFIVLVVSLSALGTLLSGLYPAFILSSFEPTQVLKGSGISKARGGILRRALVIFQFTASILLISGTFIVNDQLDFMQNGDLGFDLNSKLVLEGPSIFDSTYDAKVEMFKNELLNISNVNSVSVSSTIPGNEISWSMGIQRLQGGPENNITVDNVGIDHDYFTMFNINLVAGRDFDPNKFNESYTLIINEQLAEVLEYNKPENAIGERVRLGRDTVEIIGVVKNYHHRGLTDIIQPITYQNWYSNAYYTIDLNNTDYDGALSRIKEPWEAIFTVNPLDHFYLDEFYQRQYFRENRFGEVFALFAILAVVIACLGLFGLAAFVTLQRTKEIGIRKTLGSSSLNVIYLLSKDFIILVLISNILAVPLCWWLMNNWLETFPYRTDIDFLGFAYSGLGVIIIAILSVSLQTFKASLVNPAKTLKYE